MSDGVMDKSGKWSLMGGIFAGGRKDRTSSIVVHSDIGFSPLFSFII